MLLGGHVGGAAERAAGHGQSEVALRIADHAGDAEVGDLHPALAVQQNVFRLDVAVPDALGVRGLECIANAGHDGERLLRREASGTHGLAEVHTIDVFHQQIEEGVRVES